MTKRLDLIQGNIFKTLAKLAFPIMGTSFIQMAYGLTDTMWLGRLSTEAVAAVGIAGFLQWFGAGIILITQIGVGVKVAQLFGQEDIKKAEEYISNGFGLNILLGLIYAMFLYFFRYKIVGFFNIEDVLVFKLSIEYIIILSFGIVFHFLNPVFSTILNSTGDSVTPFKINTIGLILNIILDPLLIFGIGNIRGMGIRGAAFATITSQIIVTIIFIIVGKKYKTLYSHVKILNTPKIEYIKDIVKLGFPAFLQTAAHAGISMILTRIIADFGPTALAVQSIGSQLESMTWMTSDGFAAAISAFIGQNFGAKKYDRIKDGYKKAMQIIGGIGLFTTILFTFGGELLYKIFVPEDPLVILEGGKYLMIVGISQIFMTLEIATAGAFNGLGRPLPPAIVGIVLNVLRVPISIFLIKYTYLGLLAVWVSISVTSIIKGIILLLMFLYVSKNHLKEDFA